MILRWCNRDAVENFSCVNTFLDSLAVQKIKENITFREHRIDKIKRKLEEQEKKRAT